MKLHTLSPAVGSTKSVKRLGRGIGSGLGKTSGKGHKGQWARSGGGVRPGFEGGQTTLARRLPKRGFNNFFRKEYVIVNLEVLENFEANAVITLEVLALAGLVKGVKDNSGLKVLGNGVLTKPLTVQAAKFSEAASAAIVAAKGTVEII